jgi:hypothetical protein
LCKVNGRCVTISRERGIGSEEDYTYNEEKKGIRVKKSIIARYYPTAGVMIDSTGEKRMATLLTRKIPAAPANEIENMLAMNTARAAINLNSTMQWPPCRRTSLPSSRTPVSSLGTSAQVFSLDGLAVVPSVLHKQTPRAFNIDYNHTTVIS